MLTSHVYVVVSGYWNVYGNTARKDKHDWVIHLGDYIYEYGMGDVDKEDKMKERRTIPENTTYTLYDYRAGHGQVSRAMPCHAMRRPSSFSQADLLANPN